MFVVFGVYKIYKLWKYVNGRTWKRLHIDLVNLHHRPLVLRRFNYLILPVGCKTIWAETLWSSEAGRWRRPWRVMYFLVYCYINRRMFIYLFFSYHDSHINTVNVFSPACSRGGGGGLMCLRSLFCRLGSLASLANTQANYWHDT